MAPAEMTFQQKSLTQRGYDYSPDELRSLDWGLRFTPALCMAAAIYGLVTAQPYVHFALAALDILPFWSPAWHPLDRLYNHVVRPLFGGVRLPPNPLPRRIACLMGGSMNLFIGLAFTYNNPPWPTSWAASWSACKSSSSAPTSAWPPGCTKAS